MVDPTPKSLLIDAADELDRGEPAAAISSLRQAIDLIAPGPPWPEVPVDAAVAAELLRAHAFTEEPQEDWDDDRQPRTIIHCRSGGFGADWDLDAALELLPAAARVVWADSPMRHDLAIESPAGQFRCFDVPRPERALYVELRGL